jgi:hypothetical protein
MQYKLKDKLVFSGWDNLGLQAKKKRYTDCVRTAPGTSGLD